MDVGFREGNEFCSSYFIHCMTIKISNILLFGDQNEVWTYVKNCHEQEGERRAHYTYTPISHTIAPLIVSGVVLMPTGTTLSRSMGNRHCSLHSLTNLCMHIS